MDIRQLRYFVAVAEKLSFRRAAEQLHVAQPALSRQIQQLEDRLKVRLFDRDKRSVQLTAAGAAVLGHARVVLAAVQELPVIAQRAAAGESGQIRVGFISLVAYEFLPALVREFRQALPHVDVQMQEFPVMQQFEPLQHDQFDVAILRMLRPDPAIATYVIERAPFVVALPKGHALCRHLLLSVADLVHEDFISLPHTEGASFQGVILDLCRAAGFRPSVVREVGDSQAMMGMVGAGMGVAIVPETVRHLQTAGVEYRHLRDLTERAEIVLAWRKGQRNPLVDAFLQAAMRAFPAPAARHRRADAVAASQHA